MSDELKPCPFCGGPGYLCQIPSAMGGNRYIWIAKCSTDDGCGVEFLGTSRKVNAIKEWNTRVDGAKLKLAVEALAVSGENFRALLRCPDWSCSECAALVETYTEDIDKALKQIGEQQK